MFTSYKPGVLRPELIRLRDVLSKGSSVAKGVVDDAAKKRKGWFSSKEDIPDPAMFSMMAMVADKRLLAMIQICDHAFDNQHVVYMNEEDLMYIDGLKGLEKMMKEMDL